MIHSEVDWINYLAAHDVSVAKAIRSQNGKLAVIHRDFDVTQIDDPWCASFMRGRKQRIENDIPFIDINAWDMGEGIREPRISPIITNSFNCILEDSYKLAASIAFPLSPRPYPISF